MGLWNALACALLFCPFRSWAGIRHRGFAAPQNHAHVGSPGGQAHAETPPQVHSEPRAEGGPQYHSESHSGPESRSGQQHLPQWWAAHRNLPPSQQADAMRREQGFQNLPPGQQQRLLNRLQTFNERSPEQQQRTLGRVEMFEHLSPERQQEVRGASQALSRMSPDRQAAMRHAFQQLRQMPPDERQRMLGSSYGAQFSPQERTVLGNMLSIEPYQPQQIIHPYFGR